MAMIFCRGCGKEIHDSAQACPHCGATQLATNSDSQQSKWMAILAVILGALTFLAGVSALEEAVDADQTIGTVVLGLASISLAALNLAQKRWGKALAITGIALSSLGLLIMAGA